MDVGIRDAKNSLSRLVEAAAEGQEVFLTKHGRRMVRLVAVPAGDSSGLGRGFLKDKVNLYPGWDSRAEDLRIAAEFEVAAETDER